MLKIVSLKMETGVSFLKYHGLGNDFIVIDNLSSTRLALSPKACKKYCDRKLGIGADGVIFVLPGQQDCDYTMRMFNPDGSEAQMCGNGIRCLALFIRQHICADTSLETMCKEYRIWTGAGIVVPEVLCDGKSVRVDMGSPKLTRSESVQADDTEYKCTLVSMGNPHCIIFLTELQDDDPRVEKHGPLIENNADLFPERTNVEFIQVLHEKALCMQVWERGAARTLACGTGACASVVAAILTGQCRREDTIEVHLKHGCLQILWDIESDHVYMTGPATYVFEGHIPKSDV